jgi:hypothetical protein
MPTNISDKGSIFTSLSNSNLTTGKSSKIDFDPLLRVISPMCPRTMQIMQVRRHWYLTVEIDAVRRTGEQRRIYTKYHTKSQIEGQIYWPHHWREASCSGKPSRWTRSSKMR